MFLKYLQYLANNDLNLCLLYNHFDKKVPLCTIALDTY